MSAQWTAERSQSCFVNQRIMQINSELITTNIEGIGKPIFSCRHPGMLGTRDNRARRTTPRTARNNIP